MAQQHNWHFFRAGGFDQVKIRSGADIANLDQLDPKLWVALACPTQGLEFDAKTLALLDTDKDGRIRVPEILAAAKWTCANLKNPDSLLKSAPALPLAEINTETPEGHQLYCSAKQLLANLGKKDAEMITPEDAADTVKIFAQTNFNGDGIIHVEVSEEPAIQQAIKDVITCFGSEVDRSGKPGINQLKIDSFFKEAQAFSDWWTKSETDAAILARGQNTTAAVAAFRAVRHKVDDFFARCRLAAFDPRALIALNREEKEYLALVAKDLSITAAEVASFPLARVEAHKALPLKDAINPAWIAAVAALDVNVLKPFLGDKEMLTEAEWQTVSAKFVPYDAWEAVKAGAPVEKLGVKRVRELLANNTKGALDALIVRDKALEPEANAIAAVDKLVRFHRDFYRLLCNFVSFHDFYSRRHKAVFQSGVLYLDQRSCDLCMPVHDSGKHASLAGLSGTYLAYCDCVRKATGETRQIVAAFTAGDSDNLMVGRNGVFYDRKGQDWDATIVKIIDNPMSVQQAFWAPYKKLVRFIEENAAKRAAEADANVNANLTALAPAPAAAATKPKIDTGTLAAIGMVLTMAMGAVGAIFASIFSIKPPYLIPLVCMGMMIGISVPSVVMAALKLRRRNLGPLLDANGWAINSKAKINIPFGQSLTQVAVLPPGSQRNLVDPFAEDHKGRNWSIAIGAVVLIALGVYLWFWQLQPKLDAAKAPPALPTNAAPAVTAPSAK
ncbi:MAG: hypothetical protein ACXWBP_00430 [Limisphaerales bacterium]